MSDITERLISAAEDLAIEIVINMHKKIVPTWVLMDAKFAFVVITTPYFDQKSKARTAKRIRSAIRKHKAVAYSFVAGAWLVRKLGGPVDYPIGSPMDKREILVAVACHGKDRQWVSWDMKRDWNEQVIGLTPIKTDGGEPHGWVCEMLG